MSFAVIQQTKLGLSLAHGFRTDLVEGVFGEVGETLEELLLECFGQLVDVDVEVPLGEVVGVVVVADHDFELLVLQLLVGQTLLGSLIILHLYN